MVFGEIYTIPRKKVSADDLLNFPTDNWVRAGRGMGRFRFNQDDLVGLIISAHDLGNIDLLRCFNPKTLRVLKLSGVSYSRKLAENLARLRGLTTLVMDRCEIGDCDLAWMIRLTNLRLVVLNRTGITDRGIAALHRTLKRTTFVSESHIFPSYAKEFRDGVGRYVFTFPSERSIGQIWVKAREREVDFTEVDSWKWHIAEDWELYAPAKGVVEVPNHFFVRLSVDQDAADFSFLKRMPSWGLFSIDLRGTVFDDQWAVLLSGLVSLRVLILSRTPISDRGMACLWRLPVLNILSLSSTRVGDQGLRYLERFPSLRYLFLTNTEVSSRGLDFLVNNLQIKHLDLSYTRVADTGLEALAILPHLEALHLRGTRVSDRSLETLGWLKTLTQLDIRDTLISVRGYRELRRMLPGCQFNY